MIFQASRSVGLGSKLFEIDAQSPAECARTADGRARENAFKGNQVEFVGEVLDIELACEPHSIVKLELSAD